MKKIFKIFLITVLAFFAMEAKALTLSDVQVKKEIAKEVTQKYREYTDAELEVNVIAVPFRDLVLPDGKLSFNINSNSNKFMSRDLVKISIYVNGKFEKTFNVSIEVKAYKDVLVASSPILREKVITPSVARLERREVSKILDYALDKKSLNNELIAKKYFVAGDIIDKRFVKSKPEVLRNSIVTVVFNTNNLTVSLDGIALTDGVVGENICIMNKRYNRIYKGTVVGENRILVKI